LPASLFSINAKELSTGVTHNVERVTTV